MTSLLQARTHTMSFSESLEDFDRREDDYNSDEMYEEQLERLRSGSKQDSRCYLPSPAEIKMRQADLAWLKELRFSELFIASCMHRETPPIERVRELLCSGVTARQIMERFEPFLEE